MPLPASPRFALTEGTAAYGGSMKQERTSSPRARVENFVSMTAFFDYLEEQPATSELAKALGRIVMLRTCGVGSGRAAWSLRLTALAGGLRPFFRSLARWKTSWWRWPGNTP